METQEPTPDTERDQLVKVLGSLYQTAEHSSLTGAFRKGASNAAEYYNRILARFVERGDVSPALFPALDTESVNFDQIGIAAKLLAGFLHVDRPEKKREVRLDFEGLSNLGEVGKRIRDEFRGRGGRGGVRISFGDELEDHEAGESDEARVVEEA